MLLHKKRSIQKQCFFFLDLLFLFFYKFRWLSYILKVLYLCQTNKYLQDNVFTSLNQLILSLYLFLYPNNLATRTRLLNEMHFSVFLIYKIIFGWYFIIEMINIKKTKSYLVWGIDKSICFWINSCHFKTKMTEIYHLYFSLFI
jgi:hypothetical protein